MDWNGRLLVNFSRPAFFSQLNDIETRSEIKDKNILAVGISRT